MTNYLLLPSERYIEFPFWCLVRLFDETVKNNDLSSDHGAEKCSSKSFFCLGTDFKKAWDALDDEFTALDALLAARRQAGMTQEQVAAKMGVSQPSLARVEASLGSHRHSPSLEMLRKYAAAVNCKLEIKLVPQHS